MGENIPMFLKANIKSQGYVYVWSDKNYANIDEHLLDKALPDFAMVETGPSVAYTGSRLTANQYLLVVGGYWKNGKDEHGRSGLRFWCGALVNENRRSHDALWRFSDILLGMLQRFEIGYETIGDIVTDLAVKKQEANWANSIFKLMRETPSTMDDFGKRLVVAFLQSNKQLSSKVNLQVRFPIHPNIAAPCMLSILLFEDRVQSIGGGNLSIAPSREIQIISKDENPKNYAVTLINNLIPAKIILNDQPKPISDNENWDRRLLRRIILAVFTILIIVAWHVALYFAFRQFIR